MMNDACEFALKTAYLKSHPREVALLLENYTSAQFQALLKDIPIQTLKEALDNLPPDNFKTILEDLEDSQIIAILKTVEAEQAARLLIRYKKDDRRRFLQALPRELREDISDILQYPRGTAGSLMDPELITFRETMTAKDAIELIKERKKRGIRYLFLVNELQHPIGMLSIQTLAMAHDEAHLKDLMRPIPALIIDLTPQEEIVETLEEHKMTDLPVVNVESELIGVIRHHTLFQAAQEEMTKDLQTMVGVSEREKARSKVLFSVSKRLPWLIINLITCFMAAFVVGLFEGTIAQYTALAVLLPVVAGQSGNTGAQALAVTMRGLALKEVRFTHWFFLVWKEMRVAFFTGISVGLVTALAIGLWSQSLGLSLIIGISMVISMIIAGASGAAVPLILARIGFDPASSSSIILTTVTDVFGFFSFLGIATMLMGLI